MQWLGDPMENLTPVPCTPAFVLRIVNLRGEILSFIDIKEFFDLPDKGLTDLNKVIVLDSSNKLKSSSRSVGAMVLGDLCAELENFGKIGDKTFIAQSMAQFETVLA